MEISSHKKTSETRPRQPKMAAHEAPAAEPTDRVSLSSNEGFLVHGELCYDYDDAMRASSRHWSTMSWNPEPVYTPPIQTRSTPTEERSDGGFYVKGVLCYDYDDAMHASCYGR